jgi:predicted nuclease of predicted toxin-antitoxin system
VARWLIEQGHQVFSVFEQARGLDDDAIIQKAFAENWILITNDKDFGEKVYRERRPHRGVILLRLDNATAIAGRRRDLETGTKIIRAEFLKFGKDIRRVIPHRQLTAAIENWISGSRSSRREGGHGLHRRFVHRLCDRIQAFRIHNRNAPLHPLGHNRF